MSKLDTSMLNCMAGYGSLWHTLQFVAATFRWRCFSWHFHIFLRWITILSSK